MRMKRTVPLIAAPVSARERLICKVSARPPWDGEVPFIRQASPLNTHDFHDNPERRTYEATDPRWPVVRGPVHGLAIDGATGEYCKTRNDLEKRRVWHAQGRKAASSSPDGKLQARRQNRVPYASI